MVKATTGRGGSRAGAGRKPGSGSYGEPTTPVRIPQSLLPTVRNLLETGIRAQNSAPLPFFSSKVAAGLPSPADDHQGESVDLNEHLIRHPGQSFVVQVKGDSMTGAGIHDGDLLVVDRSLQPKPGKIVIAVINGELTVKRLAQEKNQILLLPENPDYSPIVISEGMDLIIWGVVVHVIHSLS